MKGGSLPTLRCVYCIAAKPTPPTPAAHSLPNLPPCRFSIHCTQRQPGELRAAAASFPLPVPGCADVHWCGFADEASFGATSYFIRRRQGGNILVDVPRWSPALAQRLQQLGGVAWVFLTHRDDVGEHARWARQLGARRIIHRLEASRRQGTE